MRIAIDDNINGPDASAPCDVGAGSFTIEFWVRGSLAQNNTNHAGGDVETANFNWIEGNVVFDRDIYDGSEADFGISLAGGFVRFGTGRGHPVTGQENTIEGNRQILDGLWHHVACVRDFTTGVKRIYVDGMLDFQSSVDASKGNLSFPNAGVPGQVTPWGPYIVLGAEKHDAGPAYPSFNGYLDEVRVWNTARTQTEILENHDRIVNSGTAALTGYWRFEETGGTVINDSSGAGSPAGVLIAGTPGNGERVFYVTDPFNTAPIAPAGSLLPAGFVKSTVATGFDEPTVLEFLPDGRILVGERRGVVKMIKNGALLTEPAFTANANFQGGERGLSGIAVDPNFATNSYVYLFYTNSEPRDVVDRYTMGGDKLIRTSQFRIWSGLAPAGLYHHGGVVRFGADGKLYIATGDQFDSSTSQNFGLPYGKLLRLEPDGAIPSDNPFVGQGGVLPEIYAAGLRNPFRMSVDSLTGAIWIGDVGGNNLDSFEEINRVVPGANYGWPSQEGLFCYIGNCSSFASPLFSYQHSDPVYAPQQNQGCIIMGPVYRSTAFPASFAGNIFFADYASQWIRRLVTDSGGNVVASPRFLREPGAGTIVDMRTGLDGALYYVTLGEPWSGVPDVAAIHKITYVGTGNAQPVVVTGATPAQGPQPLQVQFQSTGTNDPDQQPGPLQYSWTFGDGGTSNLPAPQHTYQNPGTYQAVLTVSDGAAVVSSTPISIQVGNPPILQMNSPAAGLVYKAGDVISYSASATDPEDGNLPASAFTWTVILVHGTHTHPFQGPLTGITSGQFTVPSTGHAPSHTHYEVVCSVVDSDGLVTSAVVPLEPMEALMVIDTVPSGLPFFLDGAPEISPAIIETLVNFQHEVEAPAAATLASVNYQFQCWFGGGAPQQTVVVPPGGLNLTAIYSETTSQTLQIAVPAVIRNAEYYVTTGQEYNNLYDPFGICIGRDQAGALQAGFQFFVPVPKDASISNAMLEFQATQDQSGAPLTVIRGYDATNPPAFNSSSNTPLTLHAPLTAASVSWNPPMFVAGQWYTTPAVHPIAQSIVNRADWAENSYMGFVIDGEATAGLEWRCLSNFQSGARPRLHITYAAGGSGGNCTPCGFSTYGSGGPPANSLGLVASGLPRIGQTVSYITTNITTGGAWTFFGSAQTSETFLDATLLVDLNSYIDGAYASADAGESTIDFTIPNDPGLIGYTAYGQSIALDPNLPNGLAFSNGLKLTICAP